MGEESAGLRGGQPQAVVPSTPFVHARVGVMRAEPDSRTRLPRQRRGLAQGGTMRVRP